MRPCPQCGHECDASHQFCPACGFPIGKIATNSDDAMLGRTLPGGYVILELIGVGGMGRVYRAEQTNLGRTVAVKIVHPHLVGEENAVARFITEARASSRLNHPNSVAIIDFGKTTDGQLYLVMEYLRGKDLARVAYEEGPLPFRRIVDVLRQVLAALSEAHHLDIIHRDLKPENIILEPIRGGGDFVKVVDFGLAKMRAEADKPSITSPGIVCGTPEYMSPEQGRGDPLDQRSDLYAVGVIMYQLLTGKLPFEADSPTQVVLMHISKQPPDPNAAAPHRKIPPALVSVCLKSLSKDPDKRYPTSEAFGLALGEAMASIETPGVAPVSGIPKPATQKCNQCGAINGATQKFCGECGAPLGDRFSGTEMQTSRRAAMAPTLSPESPRRISAQVVSQPVPSSSAPPSSTLQLPLPLVGRDDDLAWLEDRRNEAKTALIPARIIGDAGMGKSRLLNEFLAVSAAAGDVVVVTGPDPAWAEVGYHALRSAIISLAALPQNGGQMSDWPAASAEARSGLVEIFGGTNGKPAKLTPAERRFAAAEALRWALVRANTRSRGHRVVLAVDDVQNVDGASRNAFVDAVAEPPLVPVLLVASHTPGFDPGFLEGVVQPRVLQGLPGDVVLKVLAAAGVKASIPAPSGKGVSPLYVDQLVRYMREQGGAQPPSRLADLIAQRVERLPQGARRALQAFAILGDASTMSDIREMVPDEVDVEGSVFALLQAGMVEQDEGLVRNAHPLLREIVLAMIPATARRELHMKAAQIAEDRDAALEVRALHQFHAQNAFEALVLLEQVATQSAARGDTNGHIMALRRGLELARRELFRGELDDPMHAVAIFSRKLGEALATTGALTDAEGVLREALDMTDRGQDRARVLGALAHVAHGRQRDQEAQGYLKEALDLAKKSGAQDLVSSLEDLKRAIAV